MPTPEYRGKWFPNGGPQEDPLCHWFRKVVYKDLPNQFVCYDVDFILHRYKTLGDRDFQCIMCVEVKRGIETLTIEQHDTLTILGQFLRNRFANPNKLQVSRCGDLAWSPRNQKFVHVVAFGFHFLYLAENAPAEGSKMEWDGRPVTYDELVSFCTFERDPDTWQKITLDRVNYSADTEPTPIPQNKFFTERYVKLTETQALLL